MADETRAEIEARNPQRTLLMGSIRTSDLQATTDHEGIRRRVWADAEGHADRLGMTIKSIKIYPAERDISVYDPLDQQWRVRWEGVFE